MQAAIFVFGIISASLMVILPIPQLITTLKTKNISNVSYPAFFIYFIGGSIFVAVMTLLKKDIPINVDKDPIINIIGNTLFVGIMALTISSFMLFDKRINFVTKLIVITIVSAIFIGLLTWWIVEYSLKREGYFEQKSPLLTTLIIIGNSCTALPFIAQIVKTIKNRSAEGVSFILLICGLLINISLGIYFVLLLDKFSPMWFVTLLFQTVGAIVYIVQICICLMFKYKHKQMSK
ncbi:PQ-loop repeat-containing protein [Mycoplasmopsis mucosicanis]|uniref:PQ-loop repeat-containing protein n=1 Tax=Mycoplasmopsis mucosicanis TaxID=458208 RepID=A0A507SHL6_9BACT|nr:PQ-loop repeat-containing protein [Mycoplasmopsis mucosicanis]TQC51270.1 PQ-loop repeat-containing protein [Mycoplasmopsis mucosicanis]